MILNNPPLVIVVGLGHKDRALGMKDQLLWHVPEDLKRFKALTLGHPVIMGRKTFESIVKMLGKPLPGRTNIVVTRNTDYQFEGVKIAHSLEEAIQLAEAENPTEIHIGGGSELYKQALPLVTRLNVTWFYDDKEADTTFPAFEDDFEITKEYPIQNYNGLDYQWIDYGRNLS